MKTALTLLFLAAAAALFIWGALPLWDQINSLRAEEANVQDALARLKELQGLRDSLISTRDSIPKDQMDRLNKMIPQKQDVGNLLVGFEQMANSRGIKLRSVDFASDKAFGSKVTNAAAATATSTPAASSITYSLNISASYEHFRALLSALEKNLRLVDVTDISFSSGTTAGVWEISLKAKSYYQK